VGYLKSEIDERHFRFQEFSGSNCIQKNSLIVHHFQNILSKQFLSLIILTI